ncbi:hypothetical protein Nepgr_005782 [Nepenthes gracilis]|uniref:Uncharacterized protein n=1 Tax=Nepenthes gracilis TaxID=150966 RepID=A0AAD3XGS7_NEPGR|nr:hypothetical protein Nepgr_005782 [Nepenthes gracilis]
MRCRYAFRPLKCIIDRLITEHSVVRDRRKVVVEVMHHSAEFLLPPISSEPEGYSLRYALVVLNQPIPRFTPLLWNHSQLRVFANGGANRVYDELPRLFPHEDALDIRGRKAKVTCVEWHHATARTPQDSKETQTKDLNIALEGPSSPGASRFCKTGKDPHGTE